MQRRYERSVILFIIVFLSLAFPVSAAAKEIPLSRPGLKGAVSVEEAIQKRRSVRSFQAKEIPPEALSQLLWACQGITEPSRKLRACPSAGALYPLEVYVVSRQGVFRYRPATHSLAPILEKDCRRDLASAAFGQRSVAEAPVVLVLTAVYGKVQQRYGDRGRRYVDMEAGHAAENVFLQAVALGLDSVAIGAFSESKVSGILHLSPKEEPVYLLPLGYKK